MTAARCRFLLILALAVAFPGCHKPDEAAVDAVSALKPQESAPAPAATSRRIAEDEAIQIAIAYLEDGRPPEAGISYKCQNARHENRRRVGQRRYPSGWSVSLIRIPAQTGRHYIVFVTDHGEVLEVTPGA